MVKSREKRLAASNKSVGKHARRETAQPAYARVPWSGAVSRMMKTACAGSQQAQEDEVGVSLDGGADGRVGSHPLDEFVLTLGGASGG